MSFAPDAASLQYWRQIYEKEKRSQETFKRDAPKISEEWRAKLAAESPYPPREHLTSQEYGSTVKHVLLATPRYGRRELVSHVESEKRFKEFVKTHQSFVPHMTILPQNPPTPATSRASTACETVDGTVGTIPPPSRVSQVHHGNGLVTLDGRSVVSRRTVASRRTAQTARTARSHHTHHTHRSRVSQTAAPIPDKLPAAVDADGKPLNPQQIQEQLQSLQQILKEDEQRHRLHKKEMRRLRKQLQSLKA